jgi:hypothetical protein
VLLARELPARTPEEVARLIRALGSHRYIAGRLLLVHAFVFDAAGPFAGGDLEGARAWAEGVLGSAKIDRGSRDERLWRAATERELGAALAVLWNDDDAGAQARATLEARLDAIGVPLPANAASIFDENAEDDIFPVLVDAGWELLPLASLDPDRHRGAIEAFGERFAFDCAKFEEENAVPAQATLQELPLIGPAELLYGAEHAILRAPLDLWTSGNETYQDYVLRGVLRAAKLD